VLEFVVMLLKSRHEGSFGASGRLRRPPQKAAAT
jgi:hypothetical protein